MGVGSVECGLLKLVEDNEALVVVGVVRHGHGNCGRWEAPEIRVAYEGRDPFSLKGNSEALCERNTRRAKDFLHGPDGGVALPNGSRLSCGAGERFITPTCAASFKRLLGRRPEIGRAHV